MYKPSLEEFKKNAQSGNLIPVYKEILADLDTPVSAYMKIKGEYSFLFESVEGGEKWARFCFLGCDPQAVFTMKGGKVVVETDGAKTEIVSETGDALDVLKEQMQKYRPVKIDGLPRFTGGAVGFISYDMVRYFEELPDNTTDDLQIPDAQFIIADTLLIFDNVRQTIIIVSNAFVENNDPATSYREAIKKIEILENKLKQNAPAGNNSGPLKQKSSPPKFVSNFEKEKFKEAVLKIKDYILEGDAIQVVLSQRLKFEITQDPFSVYRALRSINPSPYMYYLNFGGLQVVGSSPEILVRREGEDVEVRPIAGTRKRGKNEAEDLELEKDLLADEKERAEHIMLLDLGRNDLGRIAETGTVDVNEQFTIERYSHVMHIVSNVRGKLKEGMDSFDVLRAAFPAGTVSGAPKIRAMEIIDELEPTRRGLYAGSVGYFGFEGNMDAAIAIRTLVIKNQTAYLGVGAGIVADSVPESEYEETMNKGKALLKAIELAERGLDL